MSEQIPTNDAPLLRAVPTAPLRFTPGMLVTSAELTHHAKSLGKHVKIRRGAWMLAEHFHALSVDDRHLALIHATAKQSLSDPGPLIVGASAAALWGMPWLGPWPRTVQTAAPAGATANRAPGVTRRQGVWLDETVRDGLRVSSPARTVIDVARWHGLPSGVLAADHALAAGLCTHDDLLAEADVLERGARGRRFAATAARLADGRSSSPGESLSRVHMYVIGLPRPRLQVRHEDSQGLIGFVDFEWDTLIGEFDGKVKFGAEHNSTFDEATERLWAEKRREDRLRRIKPVARWDWATARDPGALADLLGAHGIRPVRNEDWLAHRDL